MACTPLVYVSATPPSVDPPSGEAWAEPYLDATPAEATAAAVAGHINVVADFGAKPDGSEDASEAIRDAIEAAYHDVGVVYLPRGTYRLDYPLEVVPPPGASLRLFGAYADLEAGATFMGEALVRVVSPEAQVTVEGLALDVGHQAPVGLHLESLGPGSVVRHVDVRCATDVGIRVVGCSGARVENVRSRRNLGPGWRIGRSESTWLAFCAADHNRVSGFVISGFDPDADSDASNGVTLTATTSENNGQAGARFVPVAAALGAPPRPLAPVLRDGWFEGNVCDAVQLDTWNVTIHGIRFLSLGEAFDTVPPGDREYVRAVRLGSAARWANLAALQARGGDHFPSIAVEGGAFDSHYVQGNFRYGFTTASIARFMQALDPLDDAVDAVASQVCPLTYQVDPAGTP